MFIPIHPNGSFASDDDADAGVVVAGKDATDWLLLAAWMNVASAVLLIAHSLLGIISSCYTVDSDVPSDRNNSRILLVEQS
jgi:hypothetical protein